MERRSPGCRGSPNGCAGRHAISRLPPGPGHHNGACFTRRGGRRRRVVTVSASSHKRAPRIFICYVREDLARATALFHQLRSVGAEPWLDLQNLVLGDEWEAAIHNAVKQADAFVVCLRPGFDERGFRQREVRWAKEALEQRPPGQGFLIPFLLEPCDLPGWCTPFHAGDVERPTTVEALVRALNKHCDSSLALPFGGHETTRSNSQALYQIPQPPFDFTGRSEELESILAAVTRGAATSIVRGSGGIGKTVLALKVAEHLSESYPDGQLYIDLRGADEQSPVAPAAAMQHVIRSFRPFQILPDDDSELASIYRSVLHARRVLLLLDNARDGAQVAPLQPPASCYFLITSRQHFTLPGAHAIALDVLRKADACELLVRICPRLEPAASALAELCGYYALALRVSASTLATRDDLEPRAYLQRLRETKEHLDQGAPDYRRSATASISLSYNQLKQEQKQRRALLACTAETTFDVAATMALWNASENSATDTLGVLVASSLLAWNSASKRYHLHDLVRQVANARLDELDSR
jgi:hypothetical protein